MLNAYYYKRRHNKYFPKKFEIFLSQEIQRNKGLKQRPTNTFPNTPSQCEPIQTTNLFPIIFILFFLSPLPLPGALNDNNQSIEQDKFLTQIVRLTRATTTTTTANTSDQNSLGLNTSCNQTAAKHELLTNVSMASGGSKFVANTPTTNRRSLFASKIEKAVNTIKNINNTASNSSGSSENVNNSNSNHNFNTPLAFSNTQPTNSKITLSNYYRNCV